jgi:hypothetical protein
LDRPAASCCRASTIFFRSVSVMPGTKAVIACHSSSGQVRSRRRSSRTWPPECAP